MPVSLGEAIIICEAARDEHYATALLNFDRALAADGFDAEYRKQARAFFLEQAESSREDELEQLRGTVLREFQALAR
jgi:hypothetical protein